VGEMRAGRVDVQPANRDNCTFCDARDVCRVKSALHVEIAKEEGA